MALVDLTHTFEIPMPVFPGDPAPELVPVACIADHGYSDHCVKTGMHVGTHMDAPLHMIADGQMISDVPIQRFIGRGRLIDARGHDLVRAELLDTCSIAKGDFVLILTGWYKKFKDPDYFQSFPEVDRNFSERLVEMKVSALGLDTPSPDRPPFSVHKILLSNNVLIIENLTNLEALLGIEAFEIIAAPIKWRSDAAPVRALARTSDLA